MNISNNTFKEENKTDNVNQSTNMLQHGSHDLLPTGEVDPFQSLLFQLQEVVSFKEDEIFASWYNKKGKETDAQSFKAIWAKAGVIAWHLRHEQKLQKGDRAILCYNFGLDFLPSFLGCLRAGVIAVPVYPPNPAKLRQSLLKLTKIVEDCKPRVILIDSNIKKLHKISTSSLNFRSKSKQLWPQQILYITTDKIGQPKAFSSETLVFDNVAKFPSDLAFLQYTSGSTGHPKGVMITHRALKANIQLIQNSFFMSDREKYKQGADVRGFSWLPMHHDMGLVAATIFPFALGWRMHMMSPLSFLGNPLLWIDLMSRNKATFAFAPDFAFSLVTRKFIQVQGKHDGRCPIKELDLSPIRHLICGAEPIRPETHRAFYELFAPFGLRRDWFVGGYGLAESVVYVCRHSDFKISNAQELGEASLVAVGSREDFDDTLVLKVVDPDTCCELPENKTGEVWVGGPSVAAGYYGKPDLSKDVFHAKLNETILSGDQNQTFLRTGDLGFFQDNHLFICGRIKDIIIVNGVNYYPQDVEFSVQDASAVVRPGCVAAFSSNETKDGHLEIVFEIRTGNEKMAPDVVDAIRIAVTRDIGLTPTRVVAIKEKNIPKTTSGKIQRKASRKALHDGNLSIVFEWSSNEIMKNDQLMTLNSHKSSVMSAMCQDEATDTNESSTLIQELHLCNEEEHEIDDKNESFEEQIQELQLFNGGEDKTVPLEVVVEKEPDIKTVCDTVARVLELDPRSIDTSQSLVELGMSSVAAMEVADAISRIFSLEVHIELLYEAQSLETLYTSLKCRDAHECDPSMMMKVAEDLNAPTSSASDELPPIMAWYEYLFLWVLSLVFRWAWKLSSRNTHEIPADESIIFAVNHLTHCDSVMVAGMLPSRSMACRLRVVSKAEHFSSDSNPLFKFMATLLRGIPLLREDASSRIEALDACISSLQCGRSIMIHPEGTRSHDGTLLDFHGGIAHLSRQTGCKVVPCYISNAAHGAWPPSHLLPHLFSSNPVSVVFGAPMLLSDKAESDQAFTKRLRNSILELAHGLDEYPEFNGAVSGSLTGALACQGIQKVNPKSPGAVGFSISFKPSSVQQVQETVKQAKSEGRKIVPMGSGWSRGAQALVSMRSPSMAMDMTNMNKVSEIDVASKTAVVQAGAKWVDVRKTLAKHGLAPLATQSYDVFTVGGSIAANAHGRSLDTSTVAGGVLSITVVDCNGDVVSTKPDEDLFKAVCGGFGLMGIIVEVKLQLTLDSIYTTELRVLPTNQYAKCFDRDELVKKSVHFQFARLSCIPGRLFENVIWETCAEVEPSELSSYSDGVMEGPRGQGLTYKLQKFVIWALRSGKATRLLQEVRWAVETTLRQGNVGRLQRRNRTQQEDFGALLPWDGHLLEVFIPCENFIQFVDVARSILESPTAPTLLNATIRWVEKDTRSMLSYAAAGPCFSMVLFMKGKAGRDSVAITARKLYDAAIAVDGSFYLTYEPWHTDEQRKQAYPNIPKWLDQKERFDPEGLFQSAFFSEVLSEKEEMGQTGHSIHHNQSFSSPNKSLGKGTQDAPITAIVDVAPSLSQDAILEWLADIGNHVAWHGVILFQAGNKTVIVHAWMAFTLLLVAAFGNILVLAIVAIILLFENTYEIELHIPTLTVRVTSFFVERLFKVHPAADASKNSFCRVSVSIKKKRYTMHQMKDVELILWQIKQLSDYVTSFQEEEAAVAAGQSGAFQEKFECTTKDGSTIKILRLRNKEISNENRSVMYFGGYGTSSSTTASLQVVPHLLEEGFSDIWLVESRMSSEMSGIHCNRTLDDVALYDVPCAISQVRDHIGSADPLHVIAQCMGAMSVSMSLAAGATPERDVTSLTLVSVGLTPTVKYQRRLEWVVMPWIFGLNRGAEPGTILKTEGRRRYNQMSFGHRLLEFLLQRFHTHMDGVMANNGLLHGRYGGLSMAVTGAVFRDDTLAPSTRKAIAGYHMGGKVHYDFLQHMRQMYSEMGKTGKARAKRFSPASVHHMRALPEDYLEAFSMLHIPVFGFVGSKNELFGDSMCDTFAYLEKERPKSCIQKATVVPGFGHLDLCLSPAARSAWLLQMTKQFFATEETNNRLK